MVYGNVEMWQTTSLDEAICEEFFGWQWWSYLGRPTRSHPDYDSGKEIRVRRFFPPESINNDAWKRYFAETEGRPADGTEPLCYAYCSSAGPAMVPHFSGHLNDIPELQKAIKKRKCLDKYEAALAKVCGKKNVLYATAKEHCIAALVAVESRFIKKEQPNDT